MKLQGKGSEGQVLVIAVLLLSVLAILVPVLVMYSQTEARWSVAQKRYTQAFQLAEAATERGYLEVTLSTSNYAAIKNGTSITGYENDTEYSDVAGGVYAIKLASGSSIGSVVITGVGRDSSGKAVRTIQATYANEPLGNIAIYANGGVAVTGNNFAVEWGAIMTPKSITVGGRLSPQLWSAGSIDWDTNGPTPPNCDSPNCCFWHSYQSNIPPAPIIDFAYYKALAQASGTYYSGDQSMSISDTSGKTYYIDGALTMGNNNTLTGNLIIIGDLNAPNGNWGNGSASPTMGTTAWKQYCMNWSYYTGSFDGAAPTLFPGLTASYLSSPSITANLGKVAVNGFMYVGGNLNWGGGGGNADFVGVVYVNGNANLGANSHATVYYNGSVAQNIVTTNVLLTRISWEESTTAWPHGLP